MKRKQETLTTQKEILRHIYICSPLNFLFGAHKLFNDILIGNFILTFLNTQVHRFVVTLIILIHLLSSKLSP